MRAVAIRVASLAIDEILAIDNARLPTRIQQICMPCNSAVNDRNSNAGSVKPGVPGGIGADAGRCYIQQRSNRTIQRYIADIRIVGQREDIVYPKSGSNGVDQ